MDDLQKLAAQFGGTVVPEQAPQDDLSKLAAQYGGEVVPYTAGSVAKDLGKAAAAGIVPGIYGAPETVQSAVTQSQRSIFNAPTDILNTIANPELLANKVATGLGFAAPYQNKEAGTELIPTKASERAIDEVIAKGKSQTLRQLTQAGIDKASAISNSESGEFQKALQDFHPSLDLAKLAKGDISGVSMGKNPTLLGVAGQFANVFGSALPAMTATLVTKNPVYMEAMGFAQGGSEAAGNAIQYVDGMDNQKLAENSPYFRDLLARGYDPKVARSMTKEKAVDAATTAEGLVDTLGGSFTGNLLAGRFDKALLSSAKNKAARILSQTAKGTVAESIEQGLNEVADDIASDLGINKSVRKEIGTDAFATFIYGALGGAPAGALAGARAKPTGEVTPPAPPTPTATPAPKAPKAATPETVAAGLVNESDLEAPAAIVPPKVAPVETPNVPHTVEQIMERGQPVDTKQEAEKAHSDGDSVYAFHEQDLAHPKLIKDIDQMKGYTADQLLVVPKEEALKPVKKPAEAIAPLDMGENTEYRVVKNDNGWTAVLVDKDSNQLVTARNFGNTEESKQKAIDYANSEHEKAKPYIEQSVSEEKPSEEKPAEPAAEVPTEEKPVAEAEVAAEEAKPEAEEKTQAQINQERQAAKKAKVAEEVKKSLTPEDIADAGQILKSGNGLQYTEAAKPLLKKLEQAGLINQKNGKAVSYTHLTLPTKRIV